VAVDEKLGEWMVIRELPVSGVTRAWELRNLLAVRLGQVKWANGWRRYALFPEPSTLFESEGLRAITAFLDARTTERRATWRGRGAILRAE